LEPQFYRELLSGLGLAEQALPAQHDRAGWPVLRARIGAAFAGRTRAEWLRIFADTDACVSPVLSFAEAAADPQVAARGSVIDIDGAVQAAPAPLFSRSNTDVPARAVDADLGAVVLHWAG
jgi:alpha-methylacyl-CoA racemase